MIELTEMFVSKEFGEVDILPETRDKNMIKKVNNDK